MLRRLGDLGGPDLIGRAGAKAATLARLAQAGLPIPDGFVVETDWFERWYSAARPDSVPPDLPPELRIAIDVQFGSAAVAVRSSAVDEDQADASFAGQYTTVLDVSGAAAIEAALVRCWSSAHNARVAAYRALQTRDLGQRTGMGVLVQRLVQARLAGVAFTTDPFTGERADTVISAVRGLGDRLVSGEAAADEWVVRGGVATCRVAPEHVLEPTTALRIATLARRAEAILEHPVDVEWAIDTDGRLWLLQARPITALPDANVHWDPPGRGGWSRTFRFGEWLGEPVSPLAASWLLPTLEDRFWAQLDQRIGVPFRPAPSYALVNGWFYASMNFWSVNPLRVVWRLLRRKSLSRLLAAADPVHFPSTLDYWLTGWREALPTHRQRVADAEQRVDALAAPQLLDGVDELAAAAGDYFAWIGVLAGAAYKTEIPLADFYRRHLASKIGGSHQRLLAGLSASPRPAAHAVTSLDWLQPTLGELAETMPLARAEPDAQRFQRVEADRKQAEAAAQAVLVSAPRLARRFSGLLEAAQSAVRLRDGVVEPFTLAWPVMRRALLRVGDSVTNRGCIAAREDVFFLTRAELQRATQADASTIDLRSQVAERRRTWHRQRRLVAPSTLGRSWLMHGLGALAERLRDRAVASQGDHRVLLSGLPASPGRVTAAVRIIRAPEAFSELQPNEVLVAPATTPAWSILFGRAAAVVTDTGSPLAHTSLVAREFGIPAVVATGCATTRLRTGQLVTVDGSGGRVLEP